uniref:Cytochrome P450 3A29-like n=1 Tax=Crassostrea virginica TaxID=6565 RepID=A0A8B8CTY4_CRAVI|nr:cytochrome P450 3A29-like [Crassostrea virginica]
MDSLAFLGYPSVWIFLIAFLLVAIYLHVKWKFGFWHRLGVPCTDYFPYVGSLKEMKNMGIYGFDQKQIQMHGPVAGVFMGSRPALLVADPELIKKISVKDFSKAPNRYQQFAGTKSEFRHALTNVEDDHWRFMRNTLLPTFSSGKMRKMDPLLKRKYELLLETLKAKADEGKAIEFKETFGNYTMDVIASLGFGMDIDCQTNPENTFVKYAKELITFNFRIILIILLFFPRLDNILDYFNASPLNNRRIFGFFSSAVQQAIAMRDHQDKASRQDMLQLMLNAHNDTDKNEIEEEHKFENDPQKWKKRGLTIEEVTGNSILFLIAGFDTTASTMTFLSYSLATNPDCQERLLEEIDSVIGKDLPTYDNIQKLEYLDWVLNETLRLYPPGTRTNRKSNAEMDIGGYRIPKDMEINFAIYAMHRDPKQWPDPEKFDPERFSQENKAQRHPYAFLPFGHGPRNCIGQRLATMEIKCAIVYILQHYRFVTCSQTEIPLQLHTSGLLKPKNGVYLKLEER